MPIEIRCPKCEKLLRVPDNAAGKQARCPECQEIVPVPAASEPTTAPLSTPVPTPGSSFPVQSSANPFGDASPPPASGSFKPATDPSNPYAASGFVESAPISQGGLRHETVTMNEIFTATMQLFQANLGPFVIIGVLVFAVHAGISLVGFAINFGTGVLSSAVNNPAVAIAGTLLGYVFQFLTYPIPTLGALISCMKLLRDGHTSAGDFFALGRNYTVTLLRNLVLLPVALIFGAIFGVLVFAAGAAGAGGREELLIVGLLLGYAIFLAVAYAVYLLLYLSSFFIIDRQAGPIECMTLSMRYLQGNYLTVFLLTLVLFVIAVPTSICTCYLIWIFLAPIFTLVSALVYLGATGQRGAIAPALWGPAGPPEGWRVQAAFPQRG
jgi:phage FluMu protein Com